MNGQSLESSLKLYTKALEEASHNYMSNVTEALAGMTAAITDMNKPKPAPEPETPKMTLPDVIQVNSDDFVKLMQAIKVVADMTKKLIDAVGK